MFISEFLLLISRRVFPTQPSLWFLTAPFLVFAWMIRGYEFSEDLFFSKGYLPIAHRKIQELQVCDRNGDGM